MVDTDSKTRDLKQNGKQVPVRHFARELRKQIWRKIFGITAGSDKAANELKAAVLQPAAPASWKAIQKRAGQNRDLYEAAFDWIPRNRDPSDNTGDTPSSIWPRWSRAVEKDRIEKELTYKELNPNRAVEAGKQPVTETELKTMAMQIAASIKRRRAD